MSQERNPTRFVAGPEYAPYYGKLEQYVQKYNGMLRACDLPSKYYGEAWLAYRRNPEEGEA